MGRSEEDYIHVTKTYLPSIEEYLDHLQDIWKSGWITNGGEKEAELSNALKDFLGVDYLTLVANGTLAIQLAIKAFDLHGEIITTPFTYVATSTAIDWEGCTPVYVDIDEKSLCINAELIEESITEKTSAILATHVFGYPCDVERIKRIAQKHNLKVIYDAAHCFGVKWRGQSVLKYGDMSTLSFHATKIFHTAEGGAVVAKNKDWIEKVRFLKAFGHEGEDNYLLSGINAKMSELHAAMGLAVLPGVAGQIARRKEISSMYSQSLAGSTIRFLEPPADLECNYSYYPVIFSDNDQMMKTRALLRENNIFPRRYFYPSLNLLKYLQNNGYKQCPVSESVASRVLCLPLFGDLKDHQVKQIIDLILAS